jgi:hypothetical protein
MITNNVATIEMYKDVISIPPTNTDLLSNNHITIRLTKLKRKHSQKVISTK